MVIIYIGTGWLLGIWLASLLGLNHIIWLIAAALTAVAAFLLRRDPSLRLLLACVVAFCLGAWRFQASVPTIDESHIAYYNDAVGVTLSGRVVEEPTDRDTAAWLRVAVESITLENGVSRPVDGLLHVVTDALSAADYGTPLLLSGRLQRSAFGQREHIYSEMRYPEIRPRALAADSPATFYDTVLHFKRQARQTIERLIPSPEAALLIGILLGDDSGMTAELDKAFRLTGMTHIIAISGFNIALLVGFVDATGAAVLPRRWAAWLAIAVVGFYTILVGAAPSVVRAAFMGGMYLVGRRLLGRPTFPFAPLLVAAIVMTIFQPSILWDIGFQLSFTATLGLMLYAEPLTRWSKAQLAKWLEPGAVGQTLRLFSEGLIVTIAAQILTLPLLLVYFGQLPVWNLPANLLILPAQPGVMISGIFATITGLIWPALGQLFAWVSWLLLRYTIEMVRFFAIIPGAAVPLQLSSTTLAVLYTLIGGATWLMFLEQPRREALLSRLRRKLPVRAALAGSLGFAVLLFNWSWSQPDGYLHVYFLEMEQGEATLVQTPGGRHLLINGGRSPNILNEQLGQHLSFWNRSLDVVVMTEDDEWLVGGLVEAVTHYKAKQLLVGRLPSEANPTYTAVLETAQENQIPIHVAVAGERINLGDGVFLQVLDASARLALRLEYGNFSLLLPGEPNEETEQGISAVVVKATKAEHEQAIFLERVRPQIVVATADAIELSEKSKAEWTTAAHTAGSAVLFATEHRTIEITSDGRQMWLTSK